MRLGETSLKEELKNSFTPGILNVTSLPVVTGKSGEVKTKESKVRVPDEVKADDKKTEKKLAKTLISQKVPARTPAQRQIPLFSHLHQYERETSVTKDLPVAGGNLHPAVVQLGLQYAQVLKRTFFE